MELISLILMIFLLTGLSKKADNKVTVKCEFVEANDESTYGLGLIVISNFSLTLNPSLDILNYEESICICSSCFNVVGHVLQ